MSRWLGAMLLAVFTVLAASGPAAALSNLRSDTGKFVGPTER